MIIIIMIIIIIPKGPVGCSRPFRVAQATRKHDYIQTALRILYRVLFGMAGALLPHTVWHMAQHLLGLTVFRVARATHFA